MSATTATPTGRGTAHAAAVYGFAIFAAAFLLFQVEPLIAKMILPWFGGVASVWTVCLLFFQLVLLLGYSYAHLLTRLPGRAQVWTHLTLLAVSLLTLPIVPNPGFKPSSAADPAWRILALLTVTIGLPFFLLSSTSPLLQAWYNRRTGAPPYRFYAVSNAGSMLALISFPVVIEPRVRAHTLALTWSAAYVAVACLCGALAWRGRSGSAPEAAAPVAPPRWTVQALWVALAACGSAMLLAVTEYLSQNIAPVPFLWVLPLTLYLLSFIVCFAERNWYRRGLFLRLLGLAVGVLAYGLSGWFEHAPTRALIPLFCAALFVCCMFCHGEVARLKPDPQHLTSFYLMLSVGGAVGALFVALLAPRVFASVAELPISIGACAVLAVIVVGRERQSVFSASHRRARWAVLVTALVACAIVFSLARSSTRPEGFTHLMARNFYGVVRINDKVDVRLLQQPQDRMFLYEAPDPRFRELVNGATNHGIQLLMPAMRRRATTYYSTVSGVGVALLESGKRGPLRVGVIGLGAGTLATYARAGDYYRFYEINPLIINVARHDFTFVPESPGRIDIISGDARLSLEAEPPQNFDLLAVDAFSGDSIPVHLLTRQAFELYFRHLKPGGVLAVHVSNRYLDLVPVVRGAAERLGKKTVVVENKEDDLEAVFSATWVLVSAEELPYQYELLKAAEINVADGRRVLWTDDYSSIFPLLK